MKIVIVKYGMGNVTSVQKALKFIGFDSILTNLPQDFENADLIVLPGVGSFEKGMDNLKELGLIEVLNNEVIHKKKPFIGICLGMQLIASFGNEPKKVKGLNWVAGEVVQMQPQPKNSLRVPHLGWNSVKVLDDAFYKDFDNLDFYFIHSFHFKIEDEKNISMVVDYGGEMVAAIEKSNIHAFQFHPEKSQEVGMRLLRKVINKYA